MKRENGFVFWLLCFLLVSLPSVQGFSAVEETTPGGFLWSFDAGVTLQSPPSSLYNYYVSPQFGLTSEYYFTQHVGLFLTTGATMRGFQGTGVADSAWYLDLILGPTFGRRGDFFSSGARSYLRLGPLLAVPLGAYGNKLGLGLQNQSYMGVALIGGVLYPVSEGFSLGYGVMSRYGIGSAISNGSSNFWDFAITLTGSFR